MIIGNLTRNPVLKTTATGATVCTFGIATNSTWKDADGNLQERAEFHNVVSWNKLAEICAQILAMGMLVYVEGELRTRVWDDESGTRRYRTEVKIDDMKLLESKDKQGFGIDAAKEASGDKVDHTVSKDKLEKVEKEEKEEKSEKEEKKEVEKEEKIEEKKVGDDDDENEDEIEKEADDLF